MSGKHHSEEYKERKSRQMKGRYDGENNPMYGVNWKDLVTPEVIAEHSRKLSERFSGEKNPMYGKSWKDYTTQEVINGHMQKQRDNYQNLSDEEKEIRRQRMANNERRRRETDPEKYREEKSRAGKIGMSKREAYTKTQPELIVENWLNENNILNEYSPIMGDGNRNYQYDFIIKGKRILIEVNGDYWHGNPNKFNIDGSDGKRKLNDIQITKIENDKLKLEFAKNHNFEVIYIWEEEINKGDFSKLYFLKDY
jgi:G:T-mismatch repair DNA endonuclease (very short patch repair protein)